MLVIRGVGAGFLILGRYGVMYKMIVCWSDLAERADRWADGGNQSFGYDSVVVWRWRFYVFKFHDYLKFL